MNNAVVKYTKKQVAAAEKREIRARANETDIRTLPKTRIVSRLSAKAFRTVFCS